MRYPTGQTEAVTVAAAKTSTSLSAPYCHARAGAAAAAWRCDGLALDAGAAVCRFGRGRYPGRRHRVLAGDRQAERDRPEAYLRHVLGVIVGHPVGRIAELLLWAAPGLATRLDQRGGP